MQGCRVVALERTDIIGSEDRNEEAEFAAIDKLVEAKQKRERIDGDAGRGGGDKERNRVREGRVKNRLRIQEIEGAEIR
jgi:hypothetical protein